MSVGPFPEHRHGAGNQHRQGSGLHAACRGAGAAAHQHQKNGHHPSHLAELGQIRGVEARGSRRHRLEKRCPEPLGKGQAPILPEEEIKGREQNQDAGYRQNHLALHPIPGKPQSVAANILPGKKSDAANHNQQHHRHIHHRILDEGCQRRIGHLGAHQVKARIAERGNGVKHRQPNAPEALARHKHRHKGQRAQQLKEENAF